MLTMSKDSSYSVKKQPDQTKFAKACPFSQNDLPLPHYNKNDEEITITATKLSGLFS